jgi:pSer/pThr/pTyr-binding forkhead associated (FHA) protein
MSSYSYKVAVTSAPEPKPQSKQLRSGEEISIGRSSKCDISFPDIKSISNVHVNIRCNDGILELKSVSKNCTLVDRRAVEPDEWTRLREGDKITLSSDPKVKLLILSGDKKRHQLIGQGGEAIAEVKVRGQHESKDFVVRRPRGGEYVTVTIGRGKDNDIVIDDKRVSSNHFKLNFNLKNSEIEMISNSPNGTFYQNEKIENNISINLNSKNNFEFYLSSNSKPAGVVEIRPIVSNGEGGKKARREIEKIDLKWKNDFNEKINELTIKEHLLDKEIEQIENLKIKLENENISQKLKISKILHENSNLSKHQIESEYSNNIEKLKLKLNSILSEIDELNEIKNQIISKNRNNLDN